MKWAVLQTSKLGRVALLLISIAATHPAYAHEPEDVGSEHKKEPPAAEKPHHLLLQNPAGGAAQAPNVPQRDGHLSPADRKLLRQHIEDAARDMYKH